MSDDIFQNIQDDSGLRKYRIELPNMVDDKMGPYEFRLYGHYKRVCGADGGTCYESVRTTASKTRMSVGKVVETRRWLESEDWIRVTQHQNGTLTIRIVDRWLENFQRYSRSPDEHSVHDMNDAFTRRTARSPSEPKNKPYKKQPLKNEPDEKTTHVSDSGGDVWNVYQTYQNEQFGMLTTFVREDLGNLVNTYGKQAVREALGIAVRQNKRSLAYVQGILRRKAGGADRRDGGRGGTDWRQYVEGPYAGDIETGP